MDQPTKKTGPYNQKPTRRTVKGETRGQKRQKWGKKRAQGTGQGRRAVKRAVTKKKEKKQKDNKKGGGVQEKAGQRFSRGLGRSECGSVGQTKRYRED